MGEPAFDVQAALVAAMDAAPLDVKDFEPLPLDLVELARVEAAALASMMAAEPSIAELRQLGAEGLNAVIASIAETEGRLRALSDEETSHPA